MGKPSRGAVHFGRDWVGSLGMILIKESLAKPVPEGREVLRRGRQFPRGNIQGASWYLWVRGGSVLHIQGQGLGTVALSDQVSCIQSHVLVQNLVVLFQGWRRSTGEVGSVRPGSEGGVVTRGCGFASLASDPNV